MSSSPVLALAAALIGLSCFAPAPAVADDAAVAACRKHVESMLREAVQTSYGPATNVQPIDDRTVAVAGSFTSKSRNGETRNADFRCQAKRYGMLWTTSTQLLEPR